MVANFSISNPFPCCLSVAKDAYQWFSEFPLVLNGGVPGISVYWKLGTLLAFQGSLN